METIVSDLLFIGEKVINVCGIDLYEYTIREIYKHGKNDFNRLVYFSTIKPIDFFERKTVTKEQMDKINLFDIILNIDADTIKWGTDMLDLVTRKNGWTFNKLTKNFQCVVRNENGDIDILRIDRNNFQEIMDTIAIMFGATRSDPYDKYPYYDNSDDFVKEIIDEEIKKELQEQQEGKKVDGVTFSSIVEAVACHRDSGFNANTIGDLTIYQLFRILARLQQKDVYDNNMRAIYSGCVSDVKKINFAEISWLKNLEK